MSQSPLRQLLSLFENSSGALTVRFLAQELEVAPERVEGMVDFWVQKGKIRVSSSSSDCGSCGAQAACPLILNLPKTYVLAADPGEPGPVGMPCKPI
jgi:hypothetical protein